MRQPFFLASAMAAIAASLACSLLIGAAYSGGGVGVGGCACAAPAASNPAPIINANAIHIFVRIVNFPVAQRHHMVEKVLSIPQHPPFLLTIASIGEKGKGQQEANLGN